MVLFPTFNPWQLPSSPGKTVVSEGREIVILSWALASDQVTGMATSGPGRGVGEQDQSWAAHVINYRGRCRVGPRWGLWRTVMG